MLTALSPNGDPCMRLNNSGGGGTHTVVPALDELTRWTRWEQSRLPHTQNSRFQISAGPIPTGAASPSNPVNHAERC